MTVPHTHDVRTGSSRARRMLAGLMLGLILSVSTASADNCPVAAEQGHMTFPVDRLDSASRCLVSSVADSPTTAGLVGPIRIPIPQYLYEYLLDHPTIIAALLQKMGMGNYQFMHRGPNQFWGNDGDGTQGLFSLLQREGTTRIYHIDGYHEGHVFPMVRAKAVVFLKMAQTASPDGHPAVDTSLIAYTKLNDPVLSGLVWVLRPLVGDAVTRKLTRGFDVTNQLGAAIAQNPDRIIQELPTLPAIAPQEQRALTALLQTLPPTGMTLPRLTP
ncbi:MAG: hypothetical protein EPO61_14610 [Nitrospirae bacterium]|nr:MAG: hypothetical protein EPO61_14610 [Nitrospirota bacterium]